MPFVQTIRTNSLNRRAPVFEQRLIKKQVCFRTKHIEYGYQRGMTAGSAFVFTDLSAAYDTVNHIIIIYKLYNMIQDSPLCRVTQNMLSSMRFYVELNNDRSRWRKQKNGLPQGSVLFPILFNIYTNYQHLHNGTRSLIYADDLCVTANQPSFVEVETTIEESPSELTQYYRSNNLRANPDKTQVTTST